MGEVESWSEKPSPIRREAIPGGSCERFHCVEIGDDV